MKPSAIKGFDLQADLYRLWQDVIPEGFDISTLNSRPVEFFKKYGYRISALSSELYGRYNGCFSEKYVSPSLYYFYIVPYLTRMDFIFAYDDKCIYSKLWPNMRQPKAILKNMAGLYYIEDAKSFSGERVITESEAIEYLKCKSLGVIKPSLASGGDGISLLHFDEMTKEEIQSTLRLYSSNFIVQEVVRNHESLKRLNDSSLNTCRIFTYRRVGTGEYVFLGSVVRFGGKGSFRDNASSGGGFCKVDENGQIGDAIFHYKNFNKGSLRKEKGIENLVIPMFKEMIECCFTLHQGLPYNDLIGWDMTLDENGEIVLVEYNYAADAELIQISSGPLFGDYTDEIMERIMHPTSEELLMVKRSFEEYPEKVYNIDLKKVGSL